MNKRQAKKRRKFEEMPFKYKYKFTIKHDKSWGWHTGAFLCITPKDVYGKREIYLFLCFGRHDFSIGYLNIDEGEDGEL